MIAGNPEWIALIRAIGPSTHKAMSMSQLRASCSAAGLESVRTVLATGNLLFCSKKSEVQVRNILEDVIAKHGLNNDVILRQPIDLQSIVAANPMPEAADARPNHLLVVFLASEPDKSGIEALSEHEGPERTRCIGREVYIDYVDGVGGSHLPPMRVERMLNRTGTSRNWNTVRKLVEKSLS